MWFDAGDYRVFELIEPQVMQMGDRYVDGPCPVATTTNDTQDGEYISMRSNGTQPIKLYRNISNVWTRVTDPQAGDRADLTTWDGRLYRFEMINLAGATASLSQDLELHLAMNEGSGTTVGDGSGQSRDATASNNAGTANDVIVIDDSSATVVGTWNNTDRYAGYLGVRAIHNNNVKDAGTYVEYDPQLTSTQDVDVFVNYPSHPLLASVMPVLIHKADGTDTTVNVNIKSGGGQWYWLGRYELNSNSYARILTVGSSGLVCADAMKFVPVNATASTPAWVTGHGGSGSAIEFDGVDSKVELDTYTGIGSDDARTVSAWVKVPAGGRGTIVSWGDGTQANSFSLVVQNGGQWGMGTLRCETNLGYISGTRRIDDGEWHHVAVTFTPEEFTSGGPTNGYNHQVHLYIDGRLEQTTSANSSTVNTALSQHMTIGNDWRHRCFEGAIDEVRIYSRAIGEEEVATLAGQSQVLAGRLARIEDRNGYGLDIAYKTWTSQELSESPSRQWQMDTVTDAHGRVATFSYGAQQQAGRWAVSSVDLPDGETVEYGYTDGFLSSVDHPDGSTSTFGRTFDDTALCTVLAYDDVAAGPKHRRKKVYLSPQVTQEVDAALVYPLAGNLCRMMLNGDDEVTYLNMTHPGYTMFYVYEGGTKLKKFTEYLDRWQLEYAADWTKPSSGAIGFSDIGFTGEDTFSKVGLVVRTPEAYRMEPSSVTDEQGRWVAYDDYNVASQPETATYPDATTEKYEYNSFQQITRHEDRLGRVSRYTYDARGNMLMKKVGLQMVSGVETQMPEYAEYEWTYYPQGNTNQYLLKTYTDANGNTTEYVYNNNHQLTQVIEPDDTGAGTHIAHETEYESTGALRPTATEDALGRRAEYTYDARNRVIRTYYVQNDSDEKTYYGAAGSGDENLVVARKDRDDHYTQVRYDDSDRMTLMIGGLISETDALNQSYTPDPSEQMIESRTYFTGTNLTDETVTNGSKTEYGYDYRQRLVASTVYPRNGKTLSTSRNYINNELFSTTDAYGRKTYFGYRSSDGQLVRTIKGLTPGFTLADAAAVAAASRDLNANAQYLISDTTRDAEGQVTTVVDPRNVTATYEYDSRGRKTAMVAADGSAIEARTETIYDANSNVTEVRSPRYFAPGSTDPNGTGKARTTMTYTQRNLLASRTVAPGTAEAATDSYTYNDDRTLNTHTDFRGNDWQTLWRSCCQRVKAQVMPAADVDGTTNKRAGTITLQDHGGSPTYMAQVSDIDAVTNFRDPGSSITLAETTTRYDSRNRPIARTVWLVPLGTVDENDPPIAGDTGYPAADGLTTRWIYDDDLTDGEGLDDSTPTTGEVSIYRLLTELSNDGIAPGSHSTFSAAVQVSPEGELNVSVADGLGRTVITGVLAAADDPTDPLKPLTWSTTLHDNVVTLANRFSNGSGGTTNGDALETTVIDSLNETVKAHTDAAGRTIETIDQDSNVATFAYDAQGNQLQSRDANSVGVDNTFDVRGRLTQAADTQEQAESTSRLMTYDLESNVLTTTDAKGESQSYVYDPRNRQIQHTDRNAGVTTYTYDDNSNLLTITDADANSGATGESTIYTYDPRNLQLTVAYPGHNPASVINDADYDKVIYAYDGANRVRERKDQGGDTITNTYDLASRLTTKTYPWTATDTFTYDDNSRMLTAVSGLYSNTLTFTYDPAGRMASESLTTQFGTPRTYTTLRGYNTRNELVEITYPDGSVVDRTYTTRGQLDQVDYNSYMVAEFVYDNGMRETLREFGNSIETSRTYGRADNLVTAINTSGLAGLSFAYDYDANKNPTEETTGGNMSNYSWTAAQDDEDRLTEWDRAGAVGTYSQDWDLSLVGDWDSTTINGTAQSRTHNDVHEVQTVQSQTSPVYDGKGNITTDSRGQNYNWWDYNNHLVYATNTAGETISYLYDALGRRIYKEVTTPTPQGTTSQATVYICLSQMVQGRPCGQEIAEYDYAAAANSPTQNYIFGSYVDEPLALVIDPQGSPSTYYYHRNRQYSTTALTDSLGGVVERYGYTPYGETTILDPNGSTVRTASSYNNYYLYTGRRLDPETGNYYFRARYFDPQLGRFTSRDPIGYPDGYNAYAGYFAERWGWDPSGKSKAIWFNIGFDSSSKADKRTIEASKKAKSLFQDALNACCTNFMILCDTKVKFEYDYDRKNKKAPADGDYSGADEADQKLRETNLKNVKGHAGGINVLFTGATISGVDFAGNPVSAGANANTSGILAIDAELENDPNNLAHEAGHVVGYDQGNRPGDKAHSNDKGNVMYWAEQPGATGREPDRCWCEKMESKAQ